MFLVHECYSYPPYLFVKHHITMVTNDDIFDQRNTTPFWDSTSVWNIINTISLSKPACTVLFHSDKSFLTFKQCMPKQSQGQWHIKDRTCVTITFALKGERSRLKWTRSLFIYNLQWFDVQWNKSYFHKEVKYLTTTCIDEDRLDVNYLSFANTCH